VKEAHTTKRDNADAWSGGSFVWVDSSSKGRKGRAWFIAA
jgi:hypothetical protein